MCQGTPQGSVRESARRILRAYRWREPLHRLIFEVLLNLPTEIPELVRTELPARLTRKGFPDLDTADLFEPSELSKEEAERLVCQLRDATD